MSLIPEVLYRIIGKLTTFLQFQEFILRNMTVDSYTSTTWLFLHNSKRGLVKFSIRLQLYMVMCVDMVVR
jgi:hypothetical protein